MQCGGRTQGRIMWIDGIKGLAAVGVFLHHLIVLLIPAAYYGTASLSHLPYGVDVYLASSPVMFGVTGNFWVCIFCALSGIVATNQTIYLRDKKDLTDLFLKRYLKLSFPMFVVSLIVYVITQVKGFVNIPIEVAGSSLAAYAYPDRASFVQVFSHSFYYAWFTGSAVFSQAFWMMAKLFKGVCLSIALGAFEWKYKEKAILICIILAPLFGNIDIYYLIFIMGSIYAIIKKYHSKLLEDDRLGILFVVFGCFMGGYPSGVAPTNIYRGLNFLHSDVLIHAVGAICLVIGISKCKIGKNFFSSKWLVKLGEISYSVYLIHVPLMFLISTRIFNRVLQCTDRYITSTLITYTISISVVLITARVFDKWIVHPISGLVNRGIKKLSSEKRQYGQTGE